MKEPEILIIGRFSPADITISLSPSTREADPAIEGQVEDLWRAMRERAARENRVCYNGTSYRLNSLSEKAGRLAIDFGTIEYKTKECLAMIPGYFSLPDTYASRNCSTEASIRTSDGLYLLVELSGKSMNPDMIELIGGFMETEDVEMRSGESIFDFMYAEMAKEAHITKTDIKEAFLRSVYLNQHRNAEFYFEVILQVSYQELLARSKHGHDDQDIAALKAFPREEYLEQLRRHGSEVKKNKRIVAKLLSI